MTYPELPDSLQALEEEVLERWREEDLFRRTLEATADGEPFVFYEGPPTANGQPGLHHIISRTIKDLVCRYRTMQGRHVTRIAGWDTHGLPVEIEAERKLGISGKPEIEAVGIARFNEACRESVFTYKEEWESLSERIGYWLDYSRPYVTFHADYIESVWWVLKSLAEKGLMYRGHKSVPYCPRCGTALSSHEVAQGYEEIEDPSLTFLCPWLGDDGSPDPEGRTFVVWTTTPWTVPANVGLAVHPDLTYVEVEDPRVDGRRLVLAEARLEAVVDGDPPVIRRWSGSELSGVRYRRPMDVVPEPDERGNAWTVVVEDFVSAEDGTGIVHMAPAFGSDDYAAGKRHGLPMLRPVDDGGRFREGLPLVGGMFVKDADSVLVDALDDAGRLYRFGTAVHSYPHCWRCESPLIYMARDSWFAATSTLKDELLANNDSVRWHPPEIGDKRFGEWLRGNVDWALSRDRYWGTPLPVWVCDRNDEHVEWIGAFDELAERAGGLPDDFDPHRPWIDGHAWDCRECAGTMRRAPEVIDVWFDSGCMPYAQWHYPFENRKAFERHFPADFICEAIDQTRGWFYSLLAISTMLGKGTAFRSVVVNEMILDADGQKMSKSRGNAVNPWEAVGSSGADAVRWYMITSSNPWLPKRYDPEGVDEAARKFFDTLFNTYRFFSLYARTEAWEPSDADPAPAERPVLDRWLLSRLDGLVAEISAELEQYEVTRAYRSVGDFLVEDLSNWYVRRSRARFWGNTDREDRDAAFRTLWDALRTVALLIAPVSPFTADWIHRALGRGSVHLARFPEIGDAAGGVGVRNEALERSMETVRALVSLGRAAREEVQIRVRQPLRTLHAVLAGGEPGGELLELVKDELNVKEVSFLGSAAELVQLVGKPNFRSLGPRFQRHSEEAAAAIRALPGEALAAFREGGEVAIEVAGERHVLGPDDLEVAEEPRGGLVVRSEGGHTAALDPTLDEELREEGLARELVNRIQRLRRDAGLEITDRIDLGVFGPEDVRRAAHAWRDFITGETLAVGMEVGEDGAEAAPDGFEATRDVDLDGLEVVIGLSRGPEGS
ncbi:MAG: isoleucine--tRNA ligase [Gemmatimonadota bacterium]|jgi:isoleucyl-tRNA synthetase